MKSLTIAMPDLDEWLLSQCASMLDRFAWTVGQADECDGPRASTFAEPGRMPMGCGSTKSWRHDGMTTTLWSDGAGYRMAFRLESADACVEIGMEMPRTLSFLRDRTAVARLAKDVKSRIGTRVRHDHPRTVSSLAKAEGIVAALTLQATDALASGTPVRHARIRLPSPLSPKGSETVLGTDGMRELVPTAAFRSLLGSRTPSILRISNGASSGSIRLEAETVAADATAKDAMERLRIGVAASPHLRHDHAPLVEWRTPRKERP